MTDPLRHFAAIRRPRLMIRAARVGVDEYRRDRDLRRLLGATPTPGHAFRALLEAEAEAEATRQKGDADYSIARHVDLLIALLAEARLVTPRTQ